MDKKSLSKKYFLKNLLPEGLVRLEGQGTEEDLVQDQDLAIEDGAGHLLEEEEGGLVVGADFRQDDRPSEVVLVEDLEVHHQDAEEVHLDE